MHDAIDEAGVDQLTNVVGNATTDKMDGTDKPGSMVVTNSGVRATPEGINQAYMDANANHEECSIEPSTGLMVRYMVWCYNDQKGVWGWWMLSSIGTGHVRRDGGNLVADTNFEAKGCVFTVRGFIRAHEPQYTEAEPVLTVAGNVTPYDGTRQYIMVDCWKK